MSAMQLLVKIHYTLCTTIHTTLHYTTLHYTTLHYTTLHYVYLMFFSFVLVQCLHVRDAVVGEGDVCGQVLVQRADLLCDVVWWVVWWCGIMW
jgi:hypothetical protein